jgi:hypothetical protein
MPGTEVMACMDDGGRQGSYSIEPRMCSQDSVLLRSP